MLLVIQAMGTTYMYPPSGNLRGQTDIEVSEGRELLSVSPSCVRLFRRRQACSSASHNISPLLTRQSSLGSSLFLESLRSFIFFFSRRRREFGSACDEANYESDPLPS